MTERALNNDLKSRSRASSRQALNQPGDGYWVGDQAGVGGRGEEEGRSFGPLSDPLKVVPLWSYPHSPPPYVSLGSDRSLLA